MEKPSSINWKIFLILFGASVIGVIAVMPYILTLQADLLKELPMPLSVLLPIQVFQNAVIFAIFILVGLYLARRVGLGTPILEDWLEGKEVKVYLKSVLGISIALGVLAGVLIIGIDFLLSLLVEPLAIAQISPDQISPPIWQAFLGSLYGGVAEEGATRLFLVTLLVWIFYKIKRTEEGEPTNVGVWLAIIIAAILFGIGHLPAVATLTSITSSVIVPTVILNGVAGIIFGWLYWRKGLESAMIAHFSADIVLHVIFPLFR